MHNISKAICIETASTSETLSSSLEARQEPLSIWQKLTFVVKWQQLFQISVATTTFIAGAGVGREVLHDPLATAEGVLNIPIIVSQLATITTEMHLLDHPQATSLLTSDLTTLITHLTILISAFALLSQLTLGIVFSLPHFPHSVDLISSYGGATILHAALIAIHTLQAVVMKWEAFTSFVASRTLRLSARGIPTVIREERAEGNVRQVGREGCGGHSHANAGLAAILADIIAHSVSLPTFFVAWLLSTLEIRVDALAVAWVVESSTVVLLACVMHCALGGLRKAWMGVVQGKEAVDNLRGRGRKKGEVVDSV